MKLSTINYQLLTRSRKAFTLIELLVVIAIIAILAAIVMLAINPAEMMKKGRDSTRMSDMETVRKAIDMAVAENLSLSAGTIYNSIDHGRGCDVGGGWVRGIELCSYLSTLPIDPSYSSGGRYYFTTDGTYYELNAVLESASNKSKMEQDGGDDNNRYEVGTDPGLDLINP